MPAAWANSLSPSPSRPLGRKGAQSTHISAPERVSRGDQPSREKGGRFLQPLPQDGQGGNAPLPLNQAVLHLHQLAAALPAQARPAVLDGVFRLVATAKGASAPGGIPRAGATGGLRDTPHPLQGVCHPLGLEGQGGGIVHVQRGAAAAYPRIRAGRA